LGPSDYDISYMLEFIQQLGASPAAAAAASESAAVPALPHEGECKVSVSELIGESGEAEAGAPATENAPRTTPPHAASGHSPTPPPPSSGKAPRTPAERADFVLAQLMVGPGVFVSPYSPLFGSTTSRPGRLILKPGPNPSRLRRRDARSATTSSFAHFNNLFFPTFW